MPEAGGTQLPPAALANRRHWGLEAPLLAPLKGIDNRDLVASTQLPSAPRARCCMSAHCPRPSARAREAWREPHLHTTASRQITTPSLQEPAVGLAAPVGLAHA